MVLNDHRLSFRHVFNLRVSASIVIVSAVVVVLVSLSRIAAYAEQTIEQILTLVNEDPITRLDLLWSIAMDSQAPNPAGPISSDLLARKLDVMIDERLISQEAARIPSVEITRDEIERKRAELIKSFPSEAQFRERVGSVGLTPQKLEEILRQRILIDRFVDFRFRSFVLVTEQEVKRYYDEVLVPKVRAGGQVPPGLDAPQIHENIEKILKQEKVDAEINRFLATARQRADVVQLAEP